MASTQLYRRILCLLCMIAAWIYIFYYNYSYWINANADITSSFVTRADMTVGNLPKAKPFAKATFLRIKETFSKIKKEFRREKKQMSAEHVNSLETAQQLNKLFCPSDLFLLILVPSRPNSMLNRIAMRLSWARNFSTSKEGNFIESVTYRVLFVIKEHSENNNSLTKESKKFGDILRLMGNGSRRATSNLMIISAIDRILALKCKPKFVLALGDDIFVNVPEVVSWLSKLNPNVKYTGSVGLAAVQNLSNTPNNIQNVMTYCAEGAYVLAGKVLKKILNASRVIPSSKHDINEAMYVGKLAYSLGIKPHHDARFTSHPFDDLNIRDIDPCTMKKAVFVHRVFRVRHILLYTKIIVVGEQPCVI